MGAPKPVYTQDAFKVLLNADPAQLKGALLGYLAETEHGGCEGFTRADITGIRRFIADFALWVQSADHTEPCSYGVNLQWDGK